MTNEPTIAQMERLFEVCRAFIEKQEIACIETIYQCDWVIENAHDFIADVCEAIGYWKDPDEEEEDDESE